MNYSKDRKKEMTDKARILFGKLGYNGTSMRSLAEAFGCKPANIYNYFSSKEDLLFEVLREEMDDILLPVAHLAVEEITDPLEQLLFFIKNHTRVTLGHRRSANMAFDTDLGHLPPAKRKVIIKMRRQYDEIAGRIIWAGIDQGLLRDINVKLAAYNIASIISRSRVWYSPRGKLTPDQLSEVFFDLVVNGLRK